MTSEIGTQRSIVKCRALLTNLLLSANSINDVAGKSFSDAFPLARSRTPTLSSFSLKLFHARQPLDRRTTSRLDYNLRHRKRGLNRRSLQWQRCRHRINANHRLQQASTICQNAASVNSRHSMPVNGRRQ